MSKILVLHQGAIGDFLLTLSVIQALRAHLDNPQVDAIASAPSARLAGGRSAIDACKSPEDIGLHTLFSESGSLDSRLATLLGSADYVLSFLGDASEPIHHRLCEAASGKVISVDPRPSNETLETRQHITSQWCNAIRQAGLDIPEPSPPVIRMENQHDGVGQPPRIIVHPGSGGRKKCWPIDRFIELVESLDDYDVTWILGPAECEANGEQLAVIQQRVAKGCERLLIEEDLVEATRKMAGADLYIGNDAGTTHLAAAISLPTVAIFGPTDPQVWRPLGDHVTVVAPAKPGESITNVTVKKVKAVVEESQKPY